MDWMPIARLLLEVLVGGVALTSLLVLVVVLAEAYWPARKES